ncbi:MAG: hypothetical protein IKA70_00350 [Alistipes sp.]|nr:hypothetical protein [Alistipes sp.]
MGMGQTIRCRHCGTEFICLTGHEFMGQFDCSEGFCRVETEISIRCPQCMKRLNNSEREFNEQIVGQLCW